MKEANLLSAELACVLSLFHLQAPLGVNKRHLPLDEESRAAINNKGFAALKRHKWIAPNAEAGGDCLNPELLAVVVGMARSRMVIVSEARQNKSNTSKRLVHYLANNVIVEQTLSGDASYRLRSFSDASEVLLRAIRFARVPQENGIGSHSVELEGARFSRIKQLIDEGTEQQAVAELERVRMAPSAAKEAMLSISKPRFSGTIRLLKLEDGSSEDANGLAFFVGEGGCWLVVKPKSEDDNVVLCTGNEFGAWILLGSLLGELIT